MNKLMIFAASAAAVLAVGCAKNEVFQTPPAEEAVTFGVYVPQTVTKAGTAGEMTTTTLQTPGFGVFASQTVGDYNNASDKMNFMYNQHVTYDTDHWTYTPIKYWPNQVASGNTDAQPATGFAAHKVSFFAYAPYVSSASGSEGITNLSANDATGDPKVTYTVTNDLDKQVDLLWGVSHGDTWNNVAGGTNTPTNGKPYLNLQKPAIGTAVHFYFRHALAQLTLTAQAAYNQVGVGGTAQDGVKITISKVELTVPGQYTSAVLNLNNTTANTPLWEDATGSSSLSLTVTGDNLNNAIKDGGPGKTDSQPTGVIGASATNVITNGKYYTFIPTGNSTTVTVKVTYYVTTDDDNLELTYSRVENVIQKDITFASGFGGGTKNTIKMILGISEVKLEATVEDWGTGVDQDVNLPLNVAGA